MKQCDLIVTIIVIVIILVIIIVWGNDLTNWNVAWNNGCGKKWSVGRARSNSCSDKQYKYQVRNVNKHIMTDEESSKTLYVEGKNYYDTTNQTNYQNTQKNSKRCNCRGECRCVYKVEKIKHYRAPKCSPDVPSTAGYTITSTTTIVGNNTPIAPPSQCENATCASNATACGTPTPGAPTGGLFVLGASFTGKLTFCGVMGLELNLNGRSLTGNSGVTLELINCSQVWIHGGAIVNAVGTAISISCSSNVCISRINTTDTLNGISITNSYDVNIKNIYMDNITGSAMSFSCSNYLRFTNWDLSSITTYNPDLILGESSQMIFMSNMAFYNINAQNVSGTKTIVHFNNCFDVKVSHASILTTSFLATLNQNLNVYLVYFSNCGSLVLGSFIIDGDSVQVRGTSAGVFAGLRLENVNNVFTAHNLMTDNVLIGDGTSTALTFEGIHLTGVDTLGLNSSKICTNRITSATGATINSTACISVRSIYAATGSTCNSASNTSNGGNWIVSGCVCNENDIVGLSSPNSSVYGYEIIDVEKSLTMQKCTANNNGDNGNNDGVVFANEAGGFKIRGVTASNNTEINIVIDTCAANQNSSRNLTAGFYCTYSNTQIFGSEAISNISGAGKCCGFLLPGLTNVQQLTVSLFKCTGNTNFSDTGAAYGVYAGIINTGDGNTQGVQTLLIKDCTFTANGPPVGSLPPNPGYGIFMSQVTVSSIIHNILNQNNWGLFVDRGSYQSIEGNSALYNDRGFEIVTSPHSIIQKNLSQGNIDGYVDSSTLQTYLENKAVGNTGTSFELVTGSVVPWYSYNTVVGAYTLVSGPPGITTFTNLST